MPDTRSAQTDSSQPLSPAVLRFRGLDIDAFAAQQIRNIDMMGRAMELMLDSTKEISRHQAEFLKLHMNQFGGAGHSGELADEPVLVFEQQAKIYQDFFSALAEHLGKCAEVACGCGRGLIQEVSENVAHLAAEAGADNTRDAPSGKSAGTAMSKD